MDMADESFAVIETYRLKSGKTQLEVSYCPQIWVEGGEVRWPPKTLALNVERKRHSKPAEDWPKCLCRVLKNGIGIYLNLNTIVMYVIAFFHIY